MNINQVRGVPHPHIISDDDKSDDSEVESILDDVDNVPDNPEKEMIGEYLLYCNDS